MRNLLKALRGYEADEEQTPVKDYEDILRLEEEEEARKLELLPEDYVMQLPLEEFLTFKIAMLHFGLEEQLRFILAQTCKLSITQWRVMNVIGSIGHVSDSRLRLKLRMSANKLSVRTESLKADGLIQSEIEQDDEGERERFSLTEKGQGIFDKMRPVVQARQRLVMSELTSEERETLYIALDKLTAVVERQKFS